MPPEAAAESRSSPLGRRTGCEGAEPARLAVPHHPGSLVVETAGGLMVPLTRSWLQIDQLVEAVPSFWCPQWVGHPQPHPAQPGSVEAAKFTVLGLILNGPLHADNPSTLKQFGEVPVLAQLPQTSLSATVLEQLWHEQDLTTTKCCGDRPVNSRQTLRLLLFQHSALGFWCCLPISNSAGALGELWRYRH